MGVSICSPKKTTCFHSTYFFLNSLKLVLFTQTNIWHTTYIFVGTEGSFFPHERASLPTFLCYSLYPPSSFFVEARASHNYSSCVPSLPSLKRLQFYGAHNQCFFTYSSRIYVQCAYHVFTLSRNVTLDARRTNARQKSSLKMFLVFKFLNFRQTMFGEV